MSNVQRRPGADPFEITDNTLAIARRCYPHWLRRADNPSNEAVVSHLERRGLVEVKADNMFRAVPQ